ncbi:Aminopeptidase, partial [Gryllus bimaculatus]
MTSLFLGEEVFRRGVINYLKKYKYGNADRDDLYHELTKEARKQRVLSSGLTLKEILDTWTLQTGHPMRRFLFYRIARTRLASIQPACWYIPITLTTQSDQDFARTKPLAWMKCDVSELVLTNAAKEDEWYILNMQAAGIYRVFYDLENWKALSKTLNSRHYKNIAVMNRVQILNDIMHFTWTADIDADVAFRLIGYIRRETEFLPWRVALHNLERVKNIFSRTIYYNVFMTWVRRLLKPAFERVGNPEPDDLHGTRHHGQLFQWACEMQIDTCIYQARVFYAQWMRNRNPARNDV